MKISNLLQKNTRITLSIKHRYFQFGEPIFRIKMKVFVIVFEVQCLDINLLRMQIWNLEGLFAEKPFRWAAMNMPALAPALAKLDGDVLDRAEMAPWVQLPFPPLDVDGRIDVGPARLVGIRARSGEGEATGAQRQSEHVSALAPQDDRVFIPLADGVEEFFAPSWLGPGIARLELTAAFGLRRPRPPSAARAEHDRSQEPSESGTHAWRMARLPLGRNSALRPSCRAGHSAQV